MMILQNQSKTFLALKALQSTISLSQRFDANDNRQLLCLLINYSKEPRDTLKKSPLQTEMNHTCEFNQKANIIQSVKAGCAKVTRHLVLDQRPLGTTEQPRDSQWQQIIPTLEITRMDSICRSCNVFRKKIGRTKSVNKYILGPKWHWNVDKCWVMQ